MILERRCKEIVPFLHIGLVLVNLIFQLLNPLDVESVLFGHAFDRLDTDLHIFDDTQVEVCRLDGLLLLLQRGQLAIEFRLFAFELFQGSHCSKGRSLILCLLFLKSFILRFTDSLFEDIQSLLYVCDRSGKLLMSFLSLINYCCSFSGFRAKKLDFLASFADWSLAHQNYLYL